MSDNLPEPAPTLPAAATGVPAVDATSGPAAQPTIMPTATPAETPGTGQVDEDALLVGLERGDWTRAGENTGGRRGLAAFGNHQMLAKLVLSLLGVLFFAPLLYLAIVTLTSVSHATGR